jgi:hydroxymethylbilane synthase
MLRRSPDVAAALALLIDEAAHDRRACVRTRARSCHTPLAAYGEWLGDGLWLRGLLASPDGRDALRGEAEEAVADVEGAEALGRALADDPRAASRLVAE